MGFGNFGGGGGSSWNPIPPGGGGGGGQWWKSFNPGGGSYSPYTTPGGGMPGGNQYTGGFTNGYTGATKGSVRGIMGQASAPIAPGQGMPPIPPDFGGGYGEQRPFMDPRLAGLSGFLKGERDSDLTTGMDWSKRYFGDSNPQMKEILDARKEQAFGPDRETELARQAGSENINRQVQTALRQFQGRLPGTGVRGGAAGAMGAMLTRDSLNQTRGLERDLAINEMQRRREGLTNYEHSLTGERAGLLGTTFGYAGLGSQDRFGAMGYLSSQDWMKHAKEEAEANKYDPPGSSKPYYQKVWDHWTGWAH